MEAQVKKEKRTNKHHRLSISRTGGIPINGEVCGVPNVQIVDYTKHQSFHNLFQDTRPEEIANELNRNWVDPNFFILAVPRHQVREVLRYLNTLTH
jgi:hypothetical protein